MFDVQRKGEDGETYTAKGSETRCFLHHVWLQLRKVLILIIQNEQRAPGFHVG
jgi:hypothetical protein